MKRLVFGSLLLAGAFTFLTPSAARSQSLSASVTLDPAKELGPVNARLRGHNIEAADTKGIFSKETFSDVIATGTGFWNPATRSPRPEVLGVLREVGASVLRYPGGCLVHGYNWKKTIGPLAERGGWTFGLDEYLALCQGAHAEPLITVSDYTGTPQDAADLVEYLNAPADAKHPWAQKRAANGHPAPYGVRWFELGNESDHGNHDLLPHKQYSGEDYAAFALATGRAMKAVDPTIQTGIVTGPGRAPGDAWNVAALKGSLPVADFVVVHLYPVGWGNNDPSANESRLMRACMAAGDTLRGTLADYRATIKATAGRDLPIALTEYNGGFVQDVPKPYRFSLGSALFASDFVRVLQEPGSGVVMANYWQFLNGYWGMVQGGNGPLTSKPALPLFQLWGQHFGTRLVKVQTRAPRQNFEGLNDIAPMSGDHVQLAKHVGPANLFDVSSVPAGEPVQNTWKRGDDGVLRLKVKDAKGLNYLSMGEVARPIPLDGRAIIYTLSCQVRWRPDAGSRLGPLGLGLGDSRGWEATKSAVAFMGAQNASDWTNFGGDFPSLPDAPGADIIGRVESGEAPVSGTLEVRNLQVSATTRLSLPGYELLTTIASKSSDGKTLYLLAWNKDESRPITATLALPATWKNARVWSVGGPSFGTTDVGPDGVHALASGVALRSDTAGTWRYEFAPRSMTAIEWKAGG